MAGGKSFKRFITIWAGELISSIGSGLTAFALSVYVFKLSGAAASVGLVTLLAFFPTVLLSPVAGVLADRFDRRLLMMIGDSFSAMGLVFILVCKLSGDLALWQICAGVAFSSVFVSLLEPSYRATVSDLLTKDEFARASGLVQLAGAAKFLISPVIAGFLLAFTGIDTILLIDIGTFAVTLIAILTVRSGLQSKIEARESRSFTGDFKAGLAAINAKKGIMTLIILTSFVTFFIGFVQTLYTPMLLSVADEKTLGTVMSLSAAGMLAGSMFIGVLGNAKRYVRMVSLGFLCMGLAMGLLGAFTSIALIAAAGFLLFLTLPFINTGADVLIRTNIPNEKQGRVWGLIGIISQLGYIAAYAVSGILADNVFNPLLRPEGVLAGSVGKVIGVGQGRGIGLIFIVSGAFVVCLAAMIARSRPIHALEDVKCD